MTERIIPPFGGYVVYPGDHDNIFDRMFRMHHAAPDKEAHAMKPPLDIHCNDDTVVITVDLPGVDRRAIDLSVSGATLTINAKIKHTEPAQGHWVKRERRIGTYVRTVQLGGEADPNNIIANLKDGVLKVTITTARAAQAQAVNIPLN